MSKVIVKELAQEIGKQSKEIVMYLREQGHKVTNHLSIITEEEVKMVREKFAPDTLPKPARTKSAAKTAVKSTTKTAGKTAGGSRLEARENSQGGRNQGNRSGGSRSNGERTSGKRTQNAGGNRLPEDQINPEDQVSVARPAEGGGSSAGSVAEPSRQGNRNPSSSGNVQNTGRSSGERTQRFGGERSQNGRQQGGRAGQAGTSDGQSGQRNRNQSSSGRFSGERSQRFSGERGGRSGQASMHAQSVGRSSGGGYGKDRDTDNRERRSGTGGYSAGGRSSDRRGGRGQGGRGGLSIPEAPKDERITKTSTTRDRDKEREKERGRSERERGERERNKRFDKNRDMMGDEEFRPKKAKDPNRKGAFIKPEPVVKQEDGIRTIVLPDTMTLKELADQMKQAPAAVVKKLLLAGKMYSINQEITFEEAEEIALEYNCIAEREEKVDVIEELLKEQEEDENLMEKRPPVVCVMGHVDHGKTSLLDAIRETNVTAREAGGITQHIGAYVVEIDGRKITFLDTPGHEAFTSMRMRGAQATDIAILVVAADDGVMPQTVEAINHAKAAGIEIIVAINKIDKPGANIERVKQELVEHELIAEDWGGSTVFVPVSAHTKEGIDQLLEMILLTADVCEFKANPNRIARGVVIEARLDKGRGPVATVLVQKGTLHVGESIAIGSAYGKVRAMIDDKGRRLKDAGPSTPVEILGLNDVPGAGDIMMAFQNEKEARSVAETFISQSRVKLLDDTKTKLSLDGLFSQIQAGNIKELNLIIKADVQGSVEAVKQSLLKLSNEEVAIRVIHGAVGAINESDVALASASNAIIIGFNVRPDSAAKDTADREKVDIRLYRVIYNAIEDIEAAMKGMLDPVFEEKVIGHAEVRQIFKASGVGNIAGSYVLDGKIVRGCLARITRAGEKIYEGSLASLKRFKDDVKEVATGYECGLVFEKFGDLQELDLVELYVMEEVPR